MIDSHMPDGRVFFPGDQRLEGILEWPSIQPDASADIDAGAQLSMGQQTAMGGNALVKGGVVIAHPYPPHGATMAQPVVYRIAASSRRRGLASLRFNFRGVGGSLGSFSGEEEHRDVLAAAAFLAGRLAALDDDAEGREDPRPLALAGYSFGSIMAARAAAESPVPVKALALVGFVVSWEHTPGDTFERLGAYRGPVLAVCAENDDLGRPKDVERVLTDLKLDFRMSIVEGAGHFLEGRHRQVGETVAAFLSEALASGG